MSKKMKERVQTRQTEGTIAIRENPLLQKIYEAGENVYDLFRPKQIIEKKAKKNGTNN